MVTSRRSALFFFLTTACILPACGNKGSDAGDAGSDTDADTDTGVDAGDTDADAGANRAAIGVSTGSFHTFAVIEGGDVKCWGDQQWGELGYGLDLDSLPGADISLPSTLPFVDIGSSVSQIEAGVNHTCALLADGTAKCWGADGEAGVLGVHVTNASDTIGLYDVPGDYAPIDFGVPILDISTGGPETCVVLQGGDVVCFGGGLLGYAAGKGYDVDDPQGSDAVDLGGSATQVSAGLDHICAVLENGDVLCWGAGGVGALGYGNTDDVGDDEVPADVGPVDIGGPAVQVSCGDYHTCALLETGDVVCWGLGDYGMLGYGNTEMIGDDETPASVGPVDIGEAAKQVTTGAHHTCALLQSGDVKCWGQGANGHLGYGNTDDVGATNVPADVGFVDVGGLVTLIDAGMEHTCALLSTGAIRCWGNGSYGRLGYGNEDIVGDDETPAEAGDVPLL